MYVHLVCRHMKQNGCHSPCVSILRLICILEIYVGLKKGKQGHQNNFECGKGGKVWFFRESYMYLKNDREVGTKILPTGVHDTYGAILKFR